MLIENSCIKIGIVNLEQTTKILELGNIDQISDLEYSIADSYIVESVVNVVNGELVDENRTCFLASIGTFYLFVETVSKEKECKNNINKLMSRFGNNAFLESNEKV